MELKKSQKNLSNIGLTYGDIGEYEKSLDYIIQSVKIQKIIYEMDDHIKIAPNLKNIGLIYCTIGNFNQALDYLNQSLVIYRKTYESDENIAGLSTSDF